MSDQNMLAIAITHAKNSAQREEGWNNRFRAACREMRQLWISTDEDLRFRGAVGALIELEPQLEGRIRAELDLLRALSSAATRGVVIDFSTFESDEEPLGLLAIWRETA